MSAVLVPSAQRECRWNSGLDSLESVGACPCCLYDAGMSISNTRGRQTHIQGNVIDHQVHSVAVRPEFCVVDQSFSTDLSDHKPVVVAYNVEHSRVRLCMGEIVENCEKRFCFCF